MKTLTGVTPDEYFCKIRTSEPDRFIVYPIHQIPGLNTWSVIGVSQMISGDAGVGMHLQKVRQSRDGAITDKGSRVQKMNVVIGRVRNDVVPDDVTVSVLESAVFFNVEALGPIQATISDMLGNQLN